MVLDKEAEIKLKLDQRNQNNDQKYHQYLRFNNTQDFSSAWKGN